MRAGLCTVSAPLAACSPPAALPPSARFLALHLLHQQTLYFIVQAKSRVRELYHQTCVHFAQQGMLDTDLFGLALICDGEYLFAEPDSKLSKYAPKSWRSSHSHGLDANGRPALAFHLRVQFYVDTPLLLRDEHTRLHYYLQLRLNASAGHAGAAAPRLAALALLAEHGEEARARFTAAACHLPEPVNAHVFRLKATKSEPPPGSLLLAVCPQGLRVCPDTNPPSLFLWSSIGKLSFERKKFEIRTGHEKLTLYTSSDEKSRLLLALCRAAHLFSMAIAPRLSEARRAEEERRQWAGEQRVSVSSTSSNTTSGIVSDRVQSEDELEIMITSPPAPSTESLALAHLLDSAPASGRASPASAGRREAAPRPASAKTKCAGSQCSSSCSTVVVSPAPKPKRRPSTASSLELGYSHTAQNSSVSDATCIESDVPVYVSNPPPSSSGVYTLTSSDQFSTGDQVDGSFRDRSNSNLSNGSFHGDGSDPTDNKQALLSAEELSDLIVGRYPSCKSVSHTLDSDSDYVTLPSSYQGYAPIPPKRVDSSVPPPPYGAQIINYHREPPPYPETTPPIYPTDELARFIQPAGVLAASSYSLTTLPPIPPKLPRHLNAIISPNNYLDVAASKASVLVPCTFLPPPPPAPRQPPPPPPPALATVYTSQLSRSQIEQYKQQMYSDVDFVMFPLKEPALSKQDYLEAKLAALVPTQPVFYRSTSYLGRYASSQNLSDTYVQFPVYTAPSISSTGSLDPPPPPLPPNRPGRFMRTRSDDNILNSLELVPPPMFCRRLPPPPPRPLSEKPIKNGEGGVKSNLGGVKSNMGGVKSNSGEEKSNEGGVKSSEGGGKSNALDIRTLREKSKKMDLPLISALCNDRSLIKQTKAFVMPKHPNDLGMNRGGGGGGGGGVGVNDGSRVKYPVSGLSSARISKATRKMPAVSHRHPGDKLPEIPRAKPNNYVGEPHAKHKVMQSHS